MHLDTRQPRLWITRGSVSHLLISNHLHGPTLRQSKTVGALEPWCGTSRRGPFDGADLSTREPFTLHGSAQPLKRLPRREAGLLLSRSFSRWDAQQKGRPAPGRPFVWTV